MACFVATLGVIIGSGFIYPSAANVDTCELHAAVGQSLTLPFLYDGLNNAHVLRWTHNSTTIFYRLQGNVSAGKPTDITATGSLVLKNLQFSSAGAYQATLMHPNGTLAKSWTGRLCLTDKVSKPQLTYRCDFKSAAVNLNCHVADAHGLVFSWALDEETLTSETGQHLNLSLARLKGERTLTCSAANKVSKERSDAVSPTCKSPSPPPAPLLCFTSKTVLAVLAAGAGLILLLLTATVILLCSCRRRNRTQARITHNGSVRMLSITKREAESTSPDYETMHPHVDSPPLRPEPSPRSCYKGVCEPEAQAENKQLSTATEGQLQPSPVPKPRTKGPYAPGV